MPNIPGQMQLPIPGAPPEPTLRQAARELWRVGEGLWDNREDVTEPVERTWNWGTFWSRVALWFFVIATILIPLVALSGQPAIIAPMGLVPLAGLLAVFLRPHGVSPLWGGVIAYWPERIGGDGTPEKPKKGVRLGGNELRLDARRVSGVLFTEALLAEYYALMEYAAGRADVTLVFVSFVLFVTLGLGVAAQPGRLRSIGLPLVVAAIVVVSIVFALGGKSGIKAIGNDDAKAATAEVVPAEANITWVTLKGVDVCSVVVDLNAGPPGENFYGMYPEGTRINFLAHDRIILLDDLPKKEPIAASGPVCFYGPVGGKVRVRQVPDA